MTPTIYRDQVTELAKTDSAKAVEIAKKITDPWFQAQAWSHLARWANDPLLFAKHAAKSAAKTKDNYQRSAVRAWEIAALAEREYYEQARRSLSESVSLATTVTPRSSRAEALLLLFQAAFKVSIDEAENVAKLMEAACSPIHWREKRALKYATIMLSGEVPPREFFW